MCKLACLKEDARNWVMRRQVIFCGDPKRDQPKEKEDDRQEA